jgi:hypothetical protein
MLPHFRSRLQASNYPDGVTWWLDTPLVYARAHETIRVPRNFETDYASVPAFVTNVFPRSSIYTDAAVVHDWLYWHQTRA